MFIIIWLADLEHAKQLQFHTQLGHMIQKYELNVHKDRCYMVLSIIQINKDMHKLEPLIVDDDLQIMKSFYINQIIKKGNYHFDTIGTIYGL